MASAPYSFPYPSAAIYPPPLYPGGYGSVPLTHPYPVPFLPHPCYQIHAPPAESTPPPTTVPPTTVQHTIHTYASKVAAAQAQAQAAEEEQIRARLPREVLNTNRRLDHLQHSFDLLDRKSVV